MCKSRDPDLGGEAGTGSLVGGCRGSAWLFARPNAWTRAGVCPGMRAGRDWQGGERWKLCFCCDSLWPEPGFLPLWMSAMVGVTLGCLSVYAVYFIKELEQSRQDFRLCLSSQWSH